MGKKSNAGYLVMEHCEDWEQPLRIDERKDLPPGGILDWKGSKAATVFRSRKGARAAIERTHHYARAFGLKDLPERAFCKIVPVQYVTQEAPNA